MCPKLFASEWRMSFGRPFRWFNGIQLDPAGFQWKWRSIAKGFEIRSDVFDVVARFSNERVEWVKQVATCKSTYKSCTEQVVTYSLIRYTTRYPLEQQANWDGESTDNCGETNCVIYSRELNKLMGLCDHQLWSAVVNHTTIIRLISRYNAFESALNQIKAKRCGRSETLVHVAHYAIYGLPFNSS